MDFAADAVLDVIAPPARSTPTRAPSGDAADQPSFEDHLQAAQDSEPSPERAEAPPSEQAREHHSKGETPKASDPDSNADTSTAAPTQPAAEQTQTPAPVLVQLIAASPPAPQINDGHNPGTQNAAPVTAPSAPSEAPIAPTQPVQANAQPDAPAGADTAASPTGPPSGQKSASATSKGETPAAQAAQAAAQTPVSTSPAAAPVQAAIDAAPSSSSPVAEATQIAATTTAPAQPLSEHAVRQTKSAPAKNESKVEAAPAADASDTPSPALAQRPNAQAKAAPPPSAAKDAIALTPVDAPEAPPPQVATSPTAAGSQSATHTQHAGNDQSAMRAAPAAHQVAREIVRRFDGGNTRFELRLDPPELGRVEVRLDVSRDHRVTAVIAADSPQALTELARHARDLEQMLQGAGLQLSDSGLSFDLRQGGERAEPAEFSGSVADGSALPEDAAPIAARPLGYERWRGVRVDMMV